MKRLGFNTIFGAVLRAIFVGVWLWQSPGLLLGELTQEEITRYLVKIEQVRNSKQIRITENGAENSKRHARRSSATAAAAFPRKGSFHFPS
jgi:hypothetical protein